MPLWVYPEFGNMYSMFMYLRNPSLSWEDILHILSESLKFFHCLSVCIFSNLSDFAWLFKNIKNFKELIAFNYLASSKIYCFVPTIKQAPYISLWKAGWPFSIWGLLVKRMCRGLWSLVELGRMLTLRLENKFIQSKLIDTLSSLHIVFLHSPPLHVYCRPEWICSNSPVDSMQLLNSAGWRL